ncbi:MAG: uL22 family ribosomal protein [Candidatus Shapirobacteria bacterium]|jgi:large subunit ribosomal protein L22
MATSKISSPVSLAADNQPRNVRYLNKNLKISPRKLMLLVNQIRPLKPIESLVRLKLTNTKAARLLAKGVQNAVSDAKANFGLSPDTLKFSSILVGDGPKIKRMDKSHGSRFARGIIQKRHSRLTIILSSATPITDSPKPSISKTK